MHKQPFKFFCKIIIELIDQLDMIEFQVTHITQCIYFQFKRPCLAFISQTFSCEGRHPEDFTYPEKRVTIRKL